MDASAWTPVDESNIQQNSGWTPVNEAQPTSAVSRFGQSFLRGAGVMSSDEAKNFFAHPIDTLKSAFQAQGQLGEQAKQDFQNKDYVRGVQHAAEYMLPFIGPALAKAGQQLDTGDIAGGVGTTLGVAAPTITGKVGSSVEAPVPVGSLPERLYQSALKPSTTLPRAQTADLLSTGLNNAIPVSSAGLEKLGGLIGDLSDKVKDQLASQPNATVNKFAVASRLGPTAQRFAMQVNPASDLEAISNAGQEFLDNQPAKIPAQDAQALKQGTYNQLKGKAYGELKSATIEAQKALARGIKEELEAQFPEIKDLNAAQGHLIGLDGALERAVTRIDNHQLIGIGTPLAATAGRMVTGGPVGAGTAAVLKLVLDQPEIKSRIAIALNRARAGGISLPDATARVAAYTTALGNAGAQPNGTQPQSGASQ